MGPYESLVIAVFEQAVEDIGCSGIFYETDRDIFRYKEDAYRFFHSQWYRDLADFVGVDTRRVPTIVLNTAASQFSTCPRS